jgi:phosphatidylglycerophosphatase A
MGQQKTDKNFLDHITLALATLGGIGFLPALGGTCGSLAGLLVFIVFNNSIFYHLLTLLVLITSFPLSGRAEVLFQEKDSKKIIIDDFLGMLLTFLFIPRSLLFVTLGFILFRAFDFFKVYPANKIERLPGGWGIVGDDLIAGVYANLILQGVNLALKISS